MDKMLSSLCSEITPEHLDERRSRQQGLGLCQADQDLFLLNANLEWESWLLLLLAKWRYSTNALFLMKNRHVVILRMVRQRYDAITCDNDQQLEYFTKACRDRKELFLFEDELGRCFSRKDESEEDGD
ncbi:hypothetical protein HAX54_048527 [Datura stramonium]|uniref:Uncharacterized protein n=1 Tax=Datura stramonium TaxID=4076 RepID=A0ABS8WP26_DATST|nr:hypothetical protein [Datura stramonium]